MIKFSYNEKLAFERGYYVKDCKLYLNKKQISTTRLIGRYPVFRIYSGENSRKQYVVSIHRLVAYQKYGDKIYEPGIVVRHLDGNPLNFSEDNIAIGSASDNQMDIPKEIRIRSAKAAANVRKVFSESAINEIRSLYATGNYSMRILGEKFGVGKGHISSIINNKLYAS